MIRIPKRRKKEESRKKKEERRKKKEERRKKKESSAVIESSYATPQKPIRLVFEPIGVGKSIKTGTYPGPTL